MSPFLPIYAVKRISKSRTRSRDTVKSWGTQVETLNPEVHKWSKSVMVCRKLANRGEQYREPMARVKRHHCWIHQQRLQDLGGVQPAQCLYNRIGRCKNFPFPLALQMNRLTGSFCTLIVDGPWMGSKTGSKLAEGWIEYVLLTTWDENFIFLGAPGSVQFAKVTVKWVYGKEFP